MASKRMRNGSVNTLLDQQAHDLALASPEERFEDAYALRNQCLSDGVWLACIGPYYRAIANGQVGSITVPALNVRGLTYDIARAAWRAVLELACGPILFELAPSEAKAGDQPFVEYVAMVLAAAVREGYRGPVFFQADHLHVDSPDSLEPVELLCMDALDAGMRQIDIDAADLPPPQGEANRHALNARVTAAVTEFVRQRQPHPVGVRHGDGTYVLGGEVGVIGGTNTTPADLRSFMDAYRAALPDGIAGLDKISVQTGTTHGGVVQADGSVGTMPLDLDLVRELSRVAREEYGLPGVVQHGASTLSFDQFAKLPGAGAMEVHLATAMQNIIFDHDAFPAALRRRMMDELDTQSGHGEEAATPEGQAGEEEERGELTAEQRFYHNRWQAWGLYKEALWTLPPPVRDSLAGSCQDWFERLFTALNVVGRRQELEQLYDA